MPQLRLAIYKKLLLHKYIEDRATKETNNIFDIIQKRSAWNFCGIDNLSDFSFGDDVFLKGYICLQCEAEIKEDYELEQDGVNRREIWIRIGIHFILVGVILGLCGCLFHWYDSLFDFIAIIPVYIIIYVFIWGVMGWVAKVDEKKINEAIKNVRDVE